MDYSREERNVRCIVSRPDFVRELEPLAGANWHSIPAGDLGSVKRNWEILGEADRRRKHAMSAASEASAGQKTGLGGPDARQERTTDSDSAGAVMEDRHDNSSTIYVPIEANMPILEATRLAK